MLLELLLFVLSIGASVAAIGLVHVVRYPGEPIGPPILGAVAPTGRSGAAGS